MKEKASGKFIARSGRVTTGVTIREVAPTGAERKSLRMKAAAVQETSRTVVTGEPFPPQPGNQRA